MVEQSALNDNNYILNLKQSVISDFDKLIQTQEPQTKKQDVKLLAKSLMESSIAISQHLECIDESETLIEISRMASQKLSQVLKKEQCTPSTTIDSLNTMLQTEYESRLSDLQLKKNNFQTQMENALNQFDQQIQGQSTLCEQMKSTGAMLDQSMLSGFEAIIQTIKNTRQNYEQHAKVELGKIDQAIAKICGNQQDFNKKLVELLEGQIKQVKQIKTDQTEELSALMEQIEEAKQDKKPELFDKELEMQPFAEDIKPDTIILDFNSSYIKEMQKQYLAVRKDDGKTLIIYQVTSHEIVHTIDFDSQINCITSSQKYMFVGLQDKRVNIYTLGEDWGERKSVQLKQAPLCLDIFGEDDLCLVGLDFTEGESTPEYATIDIENNFALFDSTQCNPENPGKIMQVVSDKAGTQFLCNKQNKVVYIYSADKDKKYFSLVSFLKADVTIIAEISKNVFLLYNNETKTFCEFTPVDMKVKPTQIIPNLLQQENLNQILFHPSFSNDRFNLLVTFDTLQDIRVEPVTLQNQRDVDKVSPINLQSYDPQKSHIQLVHFEDDCLIVFIAWQTKEEDIHEERAWLKRDQTKRIEKHVFSDQQLKSLNEKSVYFYETNFRVVPKAEFYDPVIFNVNDNWKNQNQMII